MTQTQEHTPGPWHIVSGTLTGPEKNTTSPIEVAGLCIAHFSGGSNAAQHQKANARLIAAAPDMCDDHKENARILGYLVNELQGLIPEGKLAALELCRVRAERSAAKATGEPT